MFVVDVIPLSKGIGKETLSYFSAKKINLGSVVSIPMRKKAIPGIVVSIHSVTELKSQLKSSNYTLRNIIGVEKNSPFSPTFLKTCIQMKNYYATTTGTMIATYSPKIIFTYLDSINLGQDDTTQKSTILPERIIFQAPFEERMSYYKTLVREQFAGKKSMYFCVPSQAHAELLARELEKGIEERVIECHTGLSSKKLTETLERILNEKEALVVIGTANFLLLVDDKKFGTIVTEFEGSEYYRRQERPAVDDRDFIYTYAHTLGITFIIADELVQLSTLMQSERRYFIHGRPLNFRIKKNIPIEFDYPKEQEFQGALYPLLSENTLQTIRATIERGQHVVVFAPRKGLAPLSLCQDCGTVVTDPSGTTPLVLQEITTDGKKKRYYQNPRTKEKFEATDACKSCGGWRIKSFGIATKNILEYLEKFVDTNYYIVDSTETPTHARTKKVITEWLKNGSGILITTEKALPYLAPNTAALVVVASVESLLAGSQYTAHEKCARVLLALFDAAKEKYIVQTKNSDTTLLSCFQKKNLTEWFEESTKERETFLYPPAGCIIKIETVGSHAIIVKREKYLKETFGKYHDQYNFQMVRYSKQNLERSVSTWIIPAKEWITLPSGKEIPEIYKKFFNLLAELPEFFSVSVNPLSLL